MRDAGRVGGAEHGAVHDAGAGDGAERRERADMAAVPHLQRSAVPDRHANGSDADEGGARTADSQVPDDSRPVLHAAAHVPADHVWRQHHRQPAVDGALRRHGPERDCGSGHGQ